MNKEDVRKKLIELAEAERDTARAAYNQHLQASKPASDAAAVIDEVAQRAAEAELAEDMEGPLRDAEAKVAALQAIDFGPKDCVESGAIVTVDGRHFVIGVTTESFTCAGIELTGLSLSAPFYQAIDGLEVSDSAEFRGKVLTVESIL